MFAQLLIVLTLDLALCSFQPHPPRNFYCLFDPSLCKRYCAKMTKSNEVLSDNGIPPEDAKRCGANLNVVLNNIDFENNTFNGELLPNQTIYELELRECGFDKIGEGAFALVSVALKIVNSGMRSLEKTVFESVKNLTQFKLICETYGDFWIESGVFAGMLQLRTLEIHKCLQSEEHIQNLTASALRSLEVLDLADNELKQLGSLADLPNLQVIYLQRNKLEGIQRDAFYGTKLLSINLSDNFLKVIPEGIFANFTGALIASGNPWNCNDCNLLWLQKYLLQNLNERHEFYQPKCFNHNINLVDFSFNCSEITEVGVCIIASKLQIDGYIRDESKDINVNFNGAPVYFKFDSVADDNSSTTILTVTGFDSKHFIYWHDNSYNAEKICITNIPSYPIAAELRRGSTYTMCLAEENNNKVDPNSCFGFKVWDDWDNRTWIANKVKSEAIILYMFAVTSAILLTGICTCVCLKRRRTNGVDENMNPNVQQDVYQTDYITPNQPIYETVHYNRKPQYITAINDEKVIPYFDSGEYEEIIYKKN